MPTNGSAPSNRRRVQRIVADLGGPTIVASWCKVTPQAVSLWERVPARHVRKLADKGKMDRAKIRPDLYGDGPGR